MHWLRLIGMALVLPYACSSSSTNTSNAGGSGGASGSGGGAPAATLHCGTATCNPLKEKCCFIPAEGSVSSTFCTESAATCSGDSSRFTICDDAADCEARGSPGTFCCASVNTACLDSTVESCITGTICALAENCAGGDSVILCDPGALDACPMGRVCNPFPGKLRIGICNPS